MYRSLLLLIAIIMVLAIPARAQHPTNNLPIVQTPAQQLVMSTGEDSLSSFSVAHARTVLSGYGEIFYQRDFYHKKSTVDLRRAVLFVGHQFNGRIAFFSELEVEDAKVEGGGLQGEIGLEQAYLKFSLNPRQYIVAGLFLPRIGIINENHLPINYNGMERPMVEQLVIPSTWREIGVGFYGQTTVLPLTYSIGIVNGLDNSGFTHGTGIQGGRAEGQFGTANNLAITAALQYFYGNWKAQVSGYAGGTTGLNPKAADSLQLQSGFFGTPLYMGEADIQYFHEGLSLKALVAYASLPNAHDINRAYANNTPQSMYGFYAEAGYNVLQNANGKWAHRQLIPFVRYEKLNLNSSIPSNGVTDGTLDQSHLIAGLGFFPIPNVVIKADVRLLRTGPINPALIINPNPAAQAYNPNNTFLNIGVGYSF